jgi:hypothetical protein
MLYVITWCLMCMLDYNMFCLGLFFDFGFCNRAHLSLPELVGLKQATFNGANSEEKIWSLQAREQGRKGWHCENESRDIAAAT